MEFIKKNSTYVEAVQFLGDKTSEAEMEELMLNDYEVINLGVYTKEFKRKVYGENKKLSASFANFFL